MFINHNKREKCKDIYKTPFKKRIDKYKSRWEKCTMMLKSRYEKCINICICMIKALYLQKRT